ncbi:hypothetical protein [Hymenobacter canadensis]|uniref:Uncharacterized protein n=1 Tax=Hymenobacter canadensis TaxID=2999067 RepID=A0ABY7LRI2_9BACT|nr:hypothetical protein [Hymenobacter canadensis]WBA42537.1 hypothetical protein O3303_03020 [Hymenobacter canadensis]
MNKVLTIAALVLSLALIAYLYQTLSKTEEALKRAEQRFTDCEQVNFQLQNQLTAANRGATVPDSLKVR